MATKKIKYSEPEGYFPKAIRDSIFNDGKKKQSTSGAAKKKGGAKK